MNRCKCLGQEIQWERTIREVLESFAEVPDEDLCALAKHAREMQDNSVYGGGALEGIILRVRRAKAALAELPRKQGGDQLQTRITT